LVNWIYEWNWRAAEQTFRRGLDADPDAAEARRWYGLFLSSRARFSEASAELARAAKFDPVLLTRTAAIAWVAHLERDHPRAIEHCHRAVDLDPGWHLPHLTLGAVCLAVSRLEEAAGAFSRAARLAPEHPSSHAGLACCRWLTGQIADRDTHLARVAAAPVFASAFELAGVHALMGRADAAFEHLESAVAERAVGLIWLRVSPQFDLVREDPRFQAVLARTDRPIGEATTA
jgi:tetratricopeptide (TPR) repeat protein